MKYILTSVIVLAITAACKVPSKELSRLRESSTLSVKVSFVDGVLSYVKSAGDPEFLSYKASVPNSKFEVPEGPATSEDSLVLEPVKFAVEAVVLAEDGATKINCVNKSFDAALGSVSLICDGQWTKNKPPTTPKVDCACDGVNLTKQGLDQSFKMDALDELMCKSFESTKMFNMGSEFELSNCRDLNSKNPTPPSPPKTPPSTTQDGQCRCLGVNMVNVGVDKSFQFPAKSNSECSLLNTQVRETVFKLQNCIFVPSKDGPTPPAPTPPPPAPETRSCFCDSTPVGSGPTISGVSFKVPKSQACSTFNNSTSVISGTTYKYTNCRE
jgi:hypothetical protein